MSTDHGLPSIRNGSWYRCADGSIIEPLDFLHVLLFPNHGRDARGYNVCFLPKHRTISYLDGILDEHSQHYRPFDFVDCSIGLIILCIVVAIGMAGSKYMWEVLDKQFSSISPSHKKWYVVANISKSFFLGCTALSPKYWVCFYDILVADEFQDIALKRSVAIYVATDIVALFMVPKLPTSTILHHVTTATMCLLLFGLNLNIKGGAGILGLSKMFLVYGMFSTIPFLVNAYLAFRVVYPKSLFVRVLCRLSLVTYLMCIGVNWSLHVVWVFGYWGHREFSVYTLIYSLLFLIIARDDVILTKWLIKKNSPVNIKEE